MSSVTGRRLAAAAIVATALAGGTALGAGAAVADTPQLGSSDSGSLVYPGSAGDLIGLTTPISIPALNATLIAYCTLSADDPECPFPTFPIELGGGL